MKMSLEEFRARVRVPRTLAVAAGVLFLLGLIGALKNVLATSNSLEGTRASFWEMFWVTRGENGHTSPVLVLYVWGPVVLFAIAAVLVMIDLSMHRARVAKVYGGYLEDGFVGVQVPTGVSVKDGNITVPLMVVAVPGPDAAQFAEAASRVGTRVAALDRAQHEAWIRDVTVSAKNGFPVGDLMPELHPATLACTKRGKEEEVMVLGANGAELAILPMKRAGNAIPTLTPPSA